MRFGLSDNEPKTLGEVSDKMGLSRERVRQLEERALKQLRVDAQKAGLLEYAGPEDRRTRKLHAGMILAQQKTNILGEIVVGGSLGRLLRKQAAKQQIPGIISKNKKSTGKLGAKSSGKSAQKKTKSNVKKAKSSSKKRN